MTTYTAANASELVARINLANLDSNEPHRIMLQPPSSGNQYVLDNSFTPQGHLFGATAFPIIRRNIVIDGSALANGIKISRTATQQFRFFGVLADGVTASASLALFKYHLGE